MSYVVAYRRLKTKEGRKWNELTASKKKVGEGEGVEKIKGALKL